MIVRCTTPLCISPFQDQLYGFGYRVANQRVKDRKVRDSVRCTVCGTFIFNQQAAVIIADDTKKKKKKKK